MKSLKRVWAAAQRSPKEKTAQGRHEGAQHSASSAHSFVLGLDGCEQSIHLFGGYYIRKHAGAQSPEFSVDEQRKLVYS